MKVRKREKVETETGREEKKIRGEREREIAT